MRGHGPHPTSHSQPLKPAGSQISGPPRLGRTEGQAQGASGPTAQAALAALQSSGTRPFPAARSPAGIPTAPRPHQVSESSHPPLPARPEPRPTEQPGSAPGAQSVGFPWRPARRPRARCRSRPPPIPAPGPAHGRPRPNAGRPSVTSLGPRRVRARRAPPTPRLCGSRPAGLHRGHRRPRPAEDGEPAVGQGSPGGALNAPTPP